MIPVTVTFYGDVGFDRSYNHIIDFATSTERNNYFTPKILSTIQNCAYNKPLNTIQLKANYDDALKFTYCKFTIGSNSSHNKEIYAWVDDVVLVTDQLDFTTSTYIPILEVKISVDPIQTFMFDFSIGESFVVREHVDRFVVNGDGTKGWCLDNTSDINSVGLYKRITEIGELVSIQHFFNGADKILWLLIQQVETDEQTGRSRIILRFVPFSLTNTTKYVSYVGQGNPSGRILLLAEILNDGYINYLSLDPQTIASVTVIPFDIATFTYDTTTHRQSFNFIINEGANLEYSAINGYGAFIYTSLVNGGTLSLTRDVLFTELINNPELVVPSNNDVYSSSHEPQLFKEPYYKISLIDEVNIERGNLPSICANITNGFKGVRLHLLCDSIDVRLRVTYLFEDESPNLKLTDRFWIEYSLARADVLSSNWKSYLQQERDTTREMIASQVNQQAIANAIGGVSSSISQGGGQALSVGKAQTAQSELGAFAAGGVVGLGASAVSTIGGYAVNKHFAFEQQDIREKAIRLKANSVMMAGTLKSMINFGIKFMITKCDTTTFDIKAKEFHKYGYSVFKYETPNIKSRKYFNFIATNVVKINGNLNNEVKMAISQVFNNGVTIWHGDYISELTGIGDYTKENIERSLL